MPARTTKTAATVLAGLLSLGALVALVGATGDSHDGDENSSAAPTSAGTGDAYATAAPAAAAAAPAARPAGEESGGASAVNDSDQAVYLGGSALPAAPARVIKTAVLTVAVGKGKLTEARAAVDDVTSRLGGFQQASERSKDGASFTIRIPADKFDAALAAIRDVGDPRNETVSGEDVSAEYVDLEGRLRHWRAQEAVFLDLMARAKTIPDSISVQQQLSGVQQQIEQLEGRRRLLESQTGYSTIRLTLTVAGAPLTREAKTAGAERPILARSWDTAAGAALAVLGGTLIVLGVVLPLALIAGVPALAFLMARRRRQPVPAG